jgi:hypothetical protein
VRCHDRPFHSLVTFRDCRPTQIAEDGRYLNVRNPLHAIHGLLAATARAGGLILVTCDLVGLARSDLRVLNPLDPPGHGNDPFATTSCRRTLVGPAR